MISKINSAAISTAYTNTRSDSKSVSQKDALNVSAQGDTGKIERIKEAIEAGEYKIDLKALSEKIAEELL